MKGIPLTRAVGLKPVVAFLRRKGARVEQLLAQLNFPTGVLDDDEALIPLASAVRLLEDAATAEGVENLGLLAGQETPIDALGVFGRLIRRSPTFGEAIEIAVRMTRLFSSGVERWLEHEGDQVRLCQRFDDGPAGHAQAEQYCVMLILNLLRVAAGPDCYPSRIDLQMRRPGSLAAFLALAGARIRFERPATAVTFPRSLLRQPLPPSSGLPVVAPEVFDAWTASAPANDFPGSLVQVAGALSSSGYPQIGPTADAMGMSVRSLQRRLADAGTSYKRLLTRERRAAAAHLLEKGNARILDIALDLGYSDHAHFTRAFRRWTGIAPREFRREVRGAVMARHASVARGRARPPSPALDRRRSRERTRRSAH
jgi:AraC-like DNA-binding protein